MGVTVGWRSSAASDPGLVRTNNEDQVYVDDASGIFLVVDGMGGRAAGELAADTAVRIIPRELRSFRGDVSDGVRQAITAANNEIYRLAQDRDECHGMACVLTLAVAHDDSLTVGHVGDSRIYLVWNGTLRKLTSDHSLVGELEDHGDLTEQAAMAHPRRNEVFRDVGSMTRQPLEQEFIQIKSLPFRPDAAFLLCTDGLTDMLSSAEIGSIVQRYSGDPSTVVRELIAAANEAGGKDNVSVIFVAGPEFLGSDSDQARARVRHAITQARETRSRWRGLVARVASLFFRRGE